MSRVSRIPYHQNVYDLLQLETRSLPDAVEMIRAWEERTGAVFPAAMTEFYSTEGLIRYGREQELVWVLPLVDLWSEYSNNEYAHPLSELFGPRNRPEDLGRTPFGYRPAQYMSQLFRLIVENQGVWVLYADPDGSDNPPVFSTDGFRGPWNELGVQGKAGWQRVGAFTEVLCKWFAAYYIRDFAPLAFNSPMDPRLVGPGPEKTYRNGLWLRTPSEPFEPAVIDYLTEQLGEPERTSRPGNVTTYTFRPTGCIIRVTADEPGLGGGLSAWWLHSHSAAWLSELARLVLPFGTLRDTLRADTKPGKVVLESL
jgi:hypothetical protein